MNININETILLITTTLFYKPLYSPACLPCSTVKLYLANVRGIGILVRLCVFVLLVRTVLFDTPMDFYLTFMTSGYIENFK